MACKIDCKVVCLDVIQLMSCQKDTPVCNAAKHDKRIAQGFTQTFQQSCDHFDLGNKRLKNTNFWNFRMF